MMNVKNVIKLSAATMNEYTHTHSRKIAQPDVNIVIIHTLLVDD